MKFNTFASVDTRRAAQELAMTAPQWDAFKSRQTFPGSPHVDTKCIPLRGASSFLDSYYPKAKRRATTYAKQLPHTAALVNGVLKHMNVATVGNVLAVALRPGGYIRPHIDEGAYPEHFDRFHIAVTSPDECYFCVDGDFFFPKQGDAFFFNHRVTHSVGNPSAEWRVHIIVDVTLKEPTHEPHQ